MLQIQSVTIVQVGANDGSFESSNDPIQGYISSDDFTGRALLVEAAPNLIPALQKRFQSVDNVEILHSMVSNQSGFANFYYVNETYRKEHPQYWSIANQLGSFTADRIIRQVGQEYLAQSLVPKIDGDGIMKISGLETLDMLVVDAEGVDDVVVLSFLNANVRPRFLYYESNWINSKYWNMGQKTFNDDFLPQYGYKCQWCGKDSVVCKFDD